jgi:hypothetical protein
VDPQIHRDFELGSPQKFAARCEVETTEGEIFEQYSDIWPLTSEMAYGDIARKFRRVVLDLVPARTADHIVGEVERIEGIGDVSVLLRGLGSPGAQSSVV